MSHASRKTALLDCLDRVRTPERLSMRTTRWALLLALLGTAANGAEVYRSMDANGVPTYTDRPNGNSQQIHVATPRAGRPGNTIAPRAPAEAAGAAQTAARAATAARGQEPAEPAAEAAAPSAAEVAAQRTKNCEIARGRNDKLAVAHRIYREGANGEREYLNDAQMDEAKAQAAADVATWCD